MKRLSIDAAHAISEYGTGRSISEIARELGVCNQVVRRTLFDAGTPLRGQAVASQLRMSRRTAAEVLAHRQTCALLGEARRTSLPVAEIAERYGAGWSENAIAEFYGCARSAIRPRLIRAGVPIRNHAAAETLKWSTMDAAARKRQVSAANAAARGRQHTIAEKIQRARVVEAKALHRSPAEINLAAMLLARGIETVPQQAIGPYNCDLGAAPVAVEVFGGEWHWSGRHLLRTPRRFRYILKAGWHILVMHVTPKRFPLTEWTADYVAAYVKSMRSEPSTRCEYRVVRATGELLASGSVDDEKISIVPALTLGRDTSTGQYKSVPR